MTDRLLTAREVAERLGVTAETVLRWTRRGELPAIRLPGGAIRYREPTTSTRGSSSTRDGRGRPRSVSHPDGRAHGREATTPVRFSGVSHPAARRGDNRGGP